MDMGGSQTHLLQVFRLLDRSRFQPVLYCMTGRGALIERVDDLGVRVVDGAMSDGFGVLQIARGALRLTHFLRRERFDVVHNYLLRANIVGSIGARLAGVPVILCSKRGCHERKGKELAGVRVANTLAHGVMTNAEAVREFVHANEGCPKEKMFVIPSGVDTQRFQPLGPCDRKLSLGLDPNRPVVGIVTRMRVRKGVEEFLRAMITVRERFPAAQAVIVGEVDLDDNLRRVVSDGGLEKDLHLLGRRDDMPEIFASFDVFVLSSHDEGMSNAILEAMAMELPVVATNVGGTGEVVAEGETGLLVPPRDPAPLAEAIAALLSEPKRRLAMGQLGRKVVEERFSAAAMVRQMEDFYAAMCRKVTQ
jgi:L-malate glycosyltransferase